MKPRRFFPVGIVLLALTAAVSLAFLPIQPAWADAEDAAIFFEELQPMGNWYEDSDYGLLKNKPYKTEHFVCALLPILYTQMHW